MPISTIFPTIIAIADDALAPETHRAVRDFLDRLRAEEKPRGFRSLRSGNATSVNIETAAFREAPLTDLREAFMAQIAAMTEQLHRKKLDKYSIVKSWANFLTRDGFHHPHAHVGVSWAAVYYVSAGDAEKGAGELNLVDPRPGAYRQTNPDFGQPNPAVPVEARDNRLVVFPAWLNHYVTPYVGETERIAIATNIRTL